VIRLAPSLGVEMWDHAEQAYPHECCGFVLGTANDGIKTVRAVRGASNVRTDSPANRYSIAPDEVFRVVRESTWEIVGFYHSHPDVAARPSDYDRRHAWLWYSYLIVPVRAGRAEAMRAWVLDDDRGAFAEERIDVAQ
jgi:proteasome lid subunit RPN8/RPN11